MRQRKAKNKLLSVLLAVALILSFLPAAVLGIDPTTGGAQGAAEDVCQIGETGYPSLEEAISAALLEEDSTIKLLRSITTDKPITLTYDNDRNIEFDLDGHDLTVDTSSTPNSTALELDGGSITLKEGPGTFNVIGAFCGVNVSDGAKAVVTSAEATDEWGVAVSAGNNGSLIQVGGDVTASGTGSVGVRASDNASIEITGNIEVDGTEGTGIMVLNNGIVTLTGNVAVTGEDAAGVLVDKGGKATIDGTITTGATYIKTDGVLKEVGDHDNESIQPGYIQYSGTDGSCVWVKAASSPDGSGIWNYRSPLPPQM